MLVNEKFPNWMSIDNHGGIISNLVFPFWYSGSNYLITYNTDAFKLGNANWLNELDLTFAFKYNNRELRPMVSALDFRDGSTAAEPSLKQQTNAELLAKMINARFADKWNKIYEALTIEYNPLENYNRVEHEESERDNTGTVGNQGSESGTNGNTRTYNNIDTDTTTGGYTDTDTTAKKTKTGSTTKVTKSEQAHSVFGFDDASGFGNYPDDESTGASPITPPGSASNADSTVTSEVTTPNSYTVTNSGGISRSYGTGLVDTTAHTGTVDDSGTDSTTTSSTRTDDLQEEFSRDATTAGNIGVTTSQQMLEQELEVRKHLFYDMVIDDIASVLTLSIY